MALHIRTYIEERGEYPLDFVLYNTHHKAYLVAQLALNDGVQATAEHYGITLADVYGAMAFYYDNHDAIQNAIQEARQIGESLGATSAKSALDAIRQRE